MISAGFKDVAKQEEVDKRFDTVDARLLNLESDVSYLKARVLEIGRTLDRHDDFLSEHGKELKAHGAELKAIHKQLEALTDPTSENRVITFKELASLESRVTALERRLAPRDQ